MSHGGGVGCGGGTSTSVDEASMTKDTSFAGSGGSSREAMVVVEAVEVSGSVGERARSWWRRGEGRESLK